MSNLKTPWKNIIIGCILCYSGATQATPAPEINCLATPPTNLNWSNCNKSGLNLTNQEINFGLFHNTDFQNSNLASSNLSYSDFTGANLAGTNFNQAFLGHAIWSDGYMCKPSSLGICNKMSLDDTLQTLQKLYNQELALDRYDSAGFARYFRIVAQNSIKQILPAFSTSFQKVMAKHTEINTEDPIFHIDFEPNDQVILLEYDNHQLVAFELNAFLQYISSPNFSIRNPVKGVLRFRAN